MDLKEFHEKIDKIYQSDKETGELGSLLSEIKDDLTNLKKEYALKEETISNYESEMATLKERNTKLIEKNGEMLLRIPIDQPKTKNNQEQYKQEISVEEFLEGIEF